MPVIAERLTLKTFMTALLRLTQLSLTLLSLTLCLPSWFGHDSAVALASPPYNVPAIHLRAPNARELEYKELADIAYSRGDLAGSVAELKKAYLVRSHPRYLANLALVLVESARYQEAVEQLKRYIKTNPPIPQRDAAKSEIQRLTPDVELSSEPLGATVSIMNMPDVVGQTPLKLQLVSGQHNIQLFKEGYKPISATLLVTPGKALVANYLFDPLSADGPPRPESELKAESFTLLPRSTEGRALTYISAAAALVAGGGYLLTKGAITDRSEAQSSLQWAEAQNNVESYNRFMLGSVILAGLSGLGALSWAMFVEEDEPPKRDD